MSKVQQNILIACFADIRTNGGGATLGYNVAANLAAHGHEVNILARNGCQSSIEQKDFHGLRTTFFSLNAGKAWRLPQLVYHRQLQRILSEKVMEPDVMLAISPFFIPPARQIWPHVRIVYLFPCLLWRCLPKTWDGAWNVFRSLNHRLLQRTEHKAFDACDAVMVQSESAVQDVLDFHSEAKMKLRVAPTGVRDLQAEVVVSRRDMRYSLQTPDDAFVVVTVGNLDRNKNVGFIIDAIHQCHEQKIWLWIVGDGPIQAELKKKANAGSSSSRIRFLGTRCDMANVYAAANCLVHAAWYDTFPNVYLEAMSCGLPIIGPQNDFPNVVSALQDIIEDGKHGYLFSLSHAERLTGLLQEAVLNPVAFHTMGKAARSLAMQHYPWTRYIDAIERAISDE